MISTRLVDWSPSNPVQFGVCRLQAMPYPSSPENWVIWDITTPIAPENCTRLLPKTPQDYRTVEKRLITVSIAQCTGLTFFMSNGISRAVHRHSKQHPTAEDTFRRLPDKVREAVVWVYVPFAPGDEVTALGVRYNRYLHDRYRACFEDCCYVVGLRRLESLALLTWAVRNLSRRGLHGRAVPPREGDRRLAARGRNSRL